MEYYTQSIFLFILQMSQVLPEKVKSLLATVAFDESLALVHSKPRAVVVSLANTLATSLPYDFERATEICTSLSHTCQFCLKVDAEVRQKVVVTLDIIYQSPQKKIL